MDKPTYQIFVEEILNIVTGLILHHLSAPSGFFNNTTITSSYMYSNVYRKLNRSKFNMSSPESIITLLIIISHITQVSLAYQRNKDNRWNEAPSLPEIGFNFLATAAPAAITYFQQCRISRDQNHNHPQKGITETKENQGQKIDSINPGQSSNNSEIRSARALPSPF